MPLPPLANLFALRDDNPHRLDEVAEKLRAWGEFDEIWRPHPQWIAAVSLLPETQADPPAARAHGFVFAEGRDIVFADNSGRDPRPYAALAERVRSRPESLDQLPGDFGFMHFHPDGGATAVRACGGRVPFYLFPSPASGRGEQEVAVATRMHYLIRYAGVAPQPDPLACAAWGTGYALSPDGRSTLAGVQNLARGHAVRLGAAGGSRVMPYWDPRPNRLPFPSPDVREEHIRLLRNHLLTHLERELDPRGANLLTLSGGADSCSLAALAAGTLGKTISAWTMVPPPGPTLDFEMSYIGPLLQTLRVDRHIRTQGDRAGRVGLLAQAPPAAAPILHPALCDLPRVHREHSVRVLFGGEYADELVGSSKFTFPDWVTHTPWWRLASIPSAWPGGVKTPLRWARLRLAARRRDPPLPLAAELRAYAPAALQDEYREWLDRQLRHAAGDTGPQRHLALRCQLDGFLCMNWEACSALGIRRAWPFFHRAVLELAFACHPSELIGPGDKLLMRRALANDVPAHNLHRTDGGHWGGPDSEPSGGLRGPLPGCLDGIVDPAWVADCNNNGATMTFMEEIGIEFLRVMARRCREFAGPATN